MQVVKYHHKSSLERKKLRVLLMLSMMTAYVIDSKFGNTADQNNSAAMMNSPSSNPTPNSPTPTATNAGVNGNTNSAGVQQPVFATPVFVPNPEPTLEALNEDVIELKRRVDEHDQEISQQGNKLNNFSNTVTKMSSDIDLIKNNTSKMAQNIQLQTDQMKKVQESADAALKKAADVSNDSAKQQEILEKTSQRMDYSLNNGYPASTRPYRPYYYYDYQDVGAPPPPPSVPAYQEYDLPHSQRQGYVPQSYRSYVHPPYYAKPPVYYAPQPFYPDDSLDPAYPPQSTQDSVGAQPVYRPYPSPYYPNRVVRSMPSSQAQYNGATNGYTDQYGAPVQLQNVQQPNVQAPVQNVQQPNVQVPVQNVQPQNNAQIPSANVQMGPNSQVLGGAPSIPVQNSVSPTPGTSVHLLDANGTLVKNGDTNAANTYAVVNSYAAPALPSGQPSSNALSSGVVSASGTSNVTQAAPAVTVSSATTTAQSTQTSNNTSANTATSSTTAPAAAPTSITEDVVKGIANAFLGNPSTNTANTTTNTATPSTTTPSTATNTATPSTTGTSTTTTSAGSVVDKLVTGLFSG